MLGGCFLHSHFGIVTGPRYIEKPILTDIFPNVQLFTSIITQLHRHQLFSHTTISPHPTAISCIAGEHLRHQQSAAAP